MPTLLEAIRLKYGACADEEWPPGSSSGAEGPLADPTPAPAAGAAPEGAQDAGTGGPQRAQIASTCAEEARRDRSFFCQAGADGEGLPVAIFVPRRSPRRAVPALLVLNDCGIEAAGDARALRSACRAVEELDLAQNRLARWREVLGILQQAPRVRFLNLSFNRLAGPLRLDAGWGGAGDDQEAHGANGDQEEEEERLEVEVEVDVEDAEAEGLGPAAAPAPAPGCCPGAAPPPPLPPLRALVLNGTRVSWDSVSRLLALLPGLEELHLSLNELREVCLRPGAHGALRRLFFNRNPVSEWVQVARLGAAFPRLDALSLADCPLRSLRHANAAGLAGNAPSKDDGGDEDGTGAMDECACAALDVEAEGAGAGAGALPAHHFFRRLRCLNVSGTLLAGWDEVDRLAHFPQLTALRISGCPLLEAAQEHTQYERRQLLIARLPNIRTLNGGGLISADEREDAERAFIRYYMDKPEADRPERYNDLIAIHGRLDPLVQVDLSPEKRVKVHITCGEQSEVRSLHVYQTVADLKQKLEPFTGLSAARMRLFYVDQAMRSVHGPEEMRYPSKRLYSYNIANGDEIIVDVKQRTTERSLSTSSTGSTSSTNNNNGSCSGSSTSNGSNNGVNNNIR